MCLQYTKQLKKPPLGGLVLIHFSLEFHEIISRLSCKCGMPPVLMKQYL
nr:MAG TPA: hypothetical protein [Caudoviricetes sp.]